MPYNHHKRILGNNREAKRDFCLTDYVEGKKRLPVNCFWCGEHILSNRPCRTVPLWYAYKNRFEGHNFHPDCYMVAHAMTMKHSDFVIRPYAHIRASTSLRYESQEIPH